LDGQSSLMFFEIVKQGREAYLGDVHRLRGRLFNSLGDAEFLQKLVCGSQKKRSKMKKKEIRISK